LIDALVGLIANLIMSTVFYVPQNALTEGDISLNLISEDSLKLFSLTNPWRLSFLSSLQVKIEAVGDLQKIITTQKQYALIEITLTPISS